MRIFQTTKNFLTGQYLPLSFGQLNHSCIINLKDNSTAPNYLKSLAAKITDITEFATPLVREVAKVGFCGLLVHEGSRYITGVVLNELPEKIRGAILNVRLLEKMDRIRPYITIGAYFGALVGPLTPFALGLFATAGAINAAIDKFDDSLTSKVEGSGRYH